jgi:hypothetical protein
MHKIFELIKELNRVSEEETLWETAPGMTYWFALDTDGQSSKLCCGPLTLVDGQEFDRSTTAELLQEALRELEDHLAAMQYAKAVLERVLGDNE